MNSQEAPLGANLTNKLRYERMLQKENNEHVIDNWLENRAIEQQTSCQEYLNVIRNEIRNDLLTQFAIRKSKNSSDPCCCHLEGVHLGLLWLLIVTIILVSYIGMISTQLLR